LSVLKRAVDKRFTLNPEKINRTQLVTPLIIRPATCRDLR